MRTFSEVRPLAFRSDLIIDTAANCANYIKLVLHCSHDVKDGAWRATNSPKNWRSLDHESRNLSRIFCSHSDSDGLDLLAEEHLNQT